MIVEADRPGDPPGVRSRYRAMLRVGPVPVGGEVEIVEFAAGRELAWASLTGIDQRFRLRVRATGDGRTRLILRFGYTSPGALGVIADLAAFGQVRGVMRDLLKAVAVEAERRARGRRRAARSTPAAGRQVVRGAAALNTLLTSAASPLCAPGVRWSCSSARSSPPRWRLSD